MNRVFVILCCSVSLGAGLASAQPLSPTSEQIKRFEAMSEIDPKIAAAGEPWEVDTASREEVRQFYRAIYFASEGVPMEWTGTYTAGGSGDTSADFKEAVRVRINFFRALAGVPANITLNSTFSDKAQDAALMMSGANLLNHFPDPAWPFYTADGAEAAAASNLALGIAGPDAITGYMIDSGSNNMQVGHRRWIVYPQTQEMGTGDVAGDGTSSHPPANATWVQDANVFDPRPDTRDSFVSYPSPGYTPYQLVFPRWSLSYPGADFTSATVTMERDGVNVPVVVQHQGSGGGAPEPTIVWYIDGEDPDASTSHAKPTADTTYAISVANVMINGSAQEFEYDVIVFDPDVAGPDYTPTEVTGPSSPDVGSNNTYNVSFPAFASHFQWRTLELDDFSTIWGAEDDLQGVIASTTGGYTPRVTGGLAQAGNGAYYLAHASQPATQTLTLPETFLLPEGETGTLSFHSRLRAATTSQVARVQISLDGGTSWTEVYTQAGTGAPGENSYTLREVDLDAFAGRTFNVRFAYTFSGGSFFPQTDGSAGWLIDNISFSSAVSRVFADDPVDVTSGSSFAFNPGAAGEYVLQARGVLFTAYPIEWGPVTVVNAAEDANVPTITTHPASVATTAGSKTTLTVVATGSGTLTYQWQFRRDPSGAWTDIAGATGASYVITSTQRFHAGDYRVIVTAGTASNTSNAATLTVNAPPANNARLLNLSTRGLAQSGDNVLIPGFFIAGTGTKRLLIRAVGPSLTQSPHFVTDPVAPDPQLILKRLNTNVNPAVFVDLASNDDWGDNANAAEITTTAQDVFAFSLKDSREAALLVDLAPGGYTVIAGDKNGESGIAVVELYDADPDGGTARLINISNRGFCGVGSEVMIPGFWVSHEGPKTFLIRVVGPRLESAPFNMTGFMADPELEIFPTGSNTPILTNDDWGDNPDAEYTKQVAADVFAFSLAEGSKDAALVVTLPPGGYTVVGSSADDVSTGIVLVEVYVVE